MPKRDKGTAEADEQRQRDRAALEGLLTGVSKAEAARIKGVIDAFNQTFGDAFNRLSSGVGWDAACAAARLHIGAVIETFDGYVERPVILPNRTPLVRSRDKVTDDALMQMATAERQKAAAEGRQPNLMTVVRRARVELPGLKMSGGPAAIRKRIERLEKQAKALADMPSIFKTLFPDRDI